MIQYSLKNKKRPVVLAGAYEDSGNEYFHGSKFLCGKDKNENQSF